jgi:DNA polymerase III subunit beta
VKFSIPQADLQNSLDIVAGVVPGKTTLPILSCILLEADKNGLTLAATNLDVSILTRTERAEVQAAGKIAVPANKLVTFVRSLPAGEVTLEVKGGRLAVRCGKASLEEVCMNAQEYPALPQTAPGEGLGIDGAMLTQMVAETSYAVSRDETRPALMGILWEIAPDNLTLVATDAHRLARTSRNVAWGVEEPRSLIVDTAGLRQLPRLVNQAGDDSAVEIFVGENQLSFLCGPSVLHTRLLEGPFPDYRAVIPGNNDKSLLIDREAFILGIRRVSITADRITSQIRLGLEKDRLELSAKGTDGSSAEDELAVSYDGPALEIGFNYSYLQDILKNIASDNVQLRLRDPQSAVLVEPYAAEGEPAGLLCLLMPLRLVSD